MPFLSDVVFVLKTLPFNSELLSNKLLTCLSNTNSSVKCNIETTSVVHQFNVNNISAVPILSANLYFP